MSSETGADIGMVSLDDPGRWLPLLATAATEEFSALSTDGRWLAYASGQSGRSEIYVMRFPELEDRIAVSIGGGTVPRWSPDGRELFYIDTRGGGPAP